LAHALTASLVVSLVPPSITPRCSMARITSHLDDDVLEAFRERADAERRGCQTMTNEDLRQSLTTIARPVSADTTRRIVREELRKVG
jgi:hypothetical protein